jgi:aryl sulfotransferase
MHYSDMLANHEGAIREIAEFLEIPIQEQNMAKIIEATSFEGMRKKLLCIPAQFFTGGAQSFVNKGTNGRWKDVLTPEQLSKYDDKVNEKFSEECALWIAGGSNGFDPKST